MKLLVVAILLLPFLLFGCQKQGQSEKENKPAIRVVTIHLSSKGNDVSFDQETIQVPANTAFSLKFENDADKDSEISHNVAIIKQGMEDEVMKILNREDYEYNNSINFFKDTNYFVGISKILNPKEHGHIKVSGLKPGFYTYICLMPGHGNILNMKGKLYARKSSGSLSQKEIEISEFKEEFFRPEEIPYPEDNPYSVEKYELGKRLFFDPMLSNNDKVSCGTCHDPEMFFADGLAQSIGVKESKLERTTPTIVNLAWGELFFWDGRSPSLEHQALQPIISEEEMGMFLKDVPKKLSQSKYYLEAFKKAFSSNRIKTEMVGKAIATYERSLVSSKSPFDIWIAGNEMALTKEQIEGFYLFNTKANCVACHSGWRFTDEGFHDIGIKGSDKGRGDILSQLEKMQFAFKTPTLRHVAKTGPYFHDGSLKTLSEVINFYNRGGDMNRPSLAEDVKPLNLSELEKKQLLAFLESLNSKVNVDGL